MSLEQYFSTGRPFERPIYAAVAARMESLPPVLIEYVSVGIFFKRARTFAELRPMRDRVRLTLMLSRRLHSARVVRAFHGHGERSAYQIDLRDVQDVDEEVRDWLTEAYFASPL